MLLLGVDPEASWQMDLQCLLRAELNLDTFELEVQDIDTTIGPDRLLHATNHWHEVVPHIQKEVICVGQALTRDRLGAFSMPNAPFNTMLFRYDRQVTPDVVEQATFPEAEEVVVRELEEMGVPEVQEVIVREEEEVVVPEIQEAVFSSSRKRKAKGGKSVANRDFAIFEDGEEAAKIPSNDRASKRTTRRKSGNSRPRVPLGELSNSPERDNRRCHR